MIAKTFPFSINASIGQISKGFAEEYFTDLIDLFDWSCKDED